ncbi:hypothetical protein [Kerstersia similis]|uniref:hypothetical protein n=1 Tax=Kerstersia similis TaxID=206505 RepID=UPI0039F0FDC1
MGIWHLSEKSTILRFWYVLKKYDLARHVLVTIDGSLSEQGPMFKAGMVLRVTIIAVPSLAKNHESKRGAQMQQIKTGN